MRRVPAANASTDELSCGLLKLSTRGQKVWVAGSQIELTKLEFQLLKYFLSNGDTVLSRERILNKVWGSHADPYTNVVDVYVRRLRKKLEEGTLKGEARHGGERFIETVRGSGYRLGPCQ